jgi:hypothetical protein
LTTGIIAKSKFDGASDSHLTLVLDIILAVNQSPFIPIRTTQKACLVFLLSSTFKLNPGSIAGYAVPKDLIPQRTYSLFGFYTSV